ncbi:MAG: hypothetical protein ACTSXJ_09560 [Candidatus Baldrarchaeia archaeon]
MSRPPLDKNRFRAQPLVIKHLHRHRSEEEHICSRLKARLRRALRY